MDGQVIITSIIAVGCVTGFGIFTRKLYLTSEKMSRNRSIARDLNESENMEVH